ncbi:unnamed protein product [Moneuplotes crassus]|uniref:RING-type domain-containing protein n=1 Tax=Euplotes crassus TaxID=5936 RepID=A0AAD1YBA3_EUPCR|nr:unnamed protein product [Moneuplotes crassus]
MDNPIFNCSICCYKYNEFGRRPISLPCGHAFCQECVFKLAQHSIDDRSVETNPTISNMERVVICPSDQSTHNVVVQNLPLCFAILQHLPGVKESKEFGGMFKDKALPVPNEKVDLDSVRKEFKLIFKKATDEYKKCKFWDETIKKVSKRNDENLHEQITNINICFDNIAMSLSKKRQALIAELRSKFEEEKSNIDKEKYKRKKRFDKIQEIYTDMKRADKKIHSMDYQKVFCAMKSNQQRLNAIEEHNQDFNTKVILFDDNIKIKDSGAVYTKNKVITDEGITREVRGKSADTRMSKETFDEFEEFAKHPKFEYEGPIAPKIPKTRRNQDIARESIHKSTSPRMNRNSTVKNMNLNYVSSNKVNQDVSYNQKKVRKEGEKCQKKDSLLRKNTSNFPSAKNHRSMLKLHENGFKKVTSFFERDKSASNLVNKNQFNLDKTDNILEKYSKMPLGKIMEVPHTERSNLCNFEPPKIKPSKSRSRYDNEASSSNEKDYSQQYKRKQAKKNAAKYSEQMVKRSKEEADIIKSLAKDEFNPFLIHGHGEIKISQEYSEKVVNKKMFSRVGGHFNDKQLEKSGTFNAKESLANLKNDGSNKMKLNDNPSMSNSGHWKNNPMTNADPRRAEGILAGNEEYGTKVEFGSPSKEEMVRLKDVTKDYKSSQINPKGKFNKYTSNKNNKGGLRKIKNEKKYKENEHFPNELNKKKLDGHKIRQKKTKSRRHKRKNPDQSF